MGLSAAPHMLDFVLSILDKSTLCDLYEMQAVNSIQPKWVLMVVL